MAAAPFANIYNNSAQEIKRPDKEYYSTIQSNLKQMMRNMQQKNTKRNARAARTQIEKTSTLSGFDYSSAQKSDRMRHDLFKKQQQQRTSKSKNQAMREV